MYQFLSRPERNEPQFSAFAYFGPDWWFILHMVQTPMVGLVAIGLWLMVMPIDGRDSIAVQILAWLARAATFVFLIYYTALDAIGGIGLGRTIVITLGLLADGKLNPQQFDGAVLPLNTVWKDPWVGGVGSFISQTGSWAISAASLCVGAALGLSRRIGWLNLLPLLGFGWELQTSHASPHGPIAFALLIVAAGWLRSTHHHHRGPMPSASV